MSKSVNKKVQGAVKSVIQKVILNISIIAIFVSLAVVALAYAGLNFNLATGIVWKVAVPSIILSISNLIIYELWLRNGAESARSEEDYQTLVADYTKKTTNINEEILQECLDAEKERRYKVEEKRLTQLIERTEKIISSTTSKFRLRYLNKKLRKLTKSKDNINIILPLNRSEEFDELKYSIKTTKFKEYKPSDAQHYLTIQRTAKYTFLLTFTIVGINSVSIAVSASHWLVAVFMTILAAISILTALIGGFSAGYTSIEVYSTGVYKTALSFIEKAKAYCNRYNKKLYYTPTEYDEIPELLDKAPVLTQEELDRQAEEDLFGRAAKEVTKQ